MSGCEEAYSAGASNTTVPLIRPVSGCTLCVRALHSKICSNVYVCHDVVLLVGPTFLSMFSANMGNSHKFNCSTNKKLTKKMSNTYILNWYRQVCKSFQPQC